MIVTEKQNVLCGKPDQIQELLAEATGEDPSTTTKSAATHNNDSVTAKPTEIIMNSNQSVEEKLRTIFHLPAQEVLRGGECVFLLYKV